MALTAAEKAIARVEHGVEAPTSSERDEITRVCEGAWYGLMFVPRWKAARALPSRHTLSILRAFGPQIVEPCES